MYVLVPVCCNKYAPKLCTTNYIAELTINACPGGPGGPLPPGCPG